MKLPGRGRVLVLSGADTVLTLTPTAQEILALLADDARRVGVVTRDALGVLAVTELVTSDELVAALTRRTPPDASDLAVWAMNETSGVTLANSGTAGAAGDLTVTGTVGLGGAGVFDRALQLAAGGYARGAQTIQPANALTLSCWVYITAYPISPPTSYARIIARPMNGYSDPFMSADLTVNNDGSWGGTVNRNVPGTGAYVLSPNPLPLCTWHHIGSSFDGTTLTLYLDGTPVASLARSLTIAYTNGPDDVWCVGANAAVPVFETKLQGRVDDVRIANVARDADWFRQVWTRGVGWAF